MPDATEDEVFQAAQDEVADEGAAGEDADKAGRQGAKGKPPQGGGAPEAEAQAEEEHVPVSQAGGQGTNRTVVGEGGGDEEDDGSGGGGGAGGAGGAGGDDGDGDEKKEPEEEEEAEGEEEEAEEEEDEEEDMTTDDDARGARDASTRRAADPDPVEAGTAGTHERGSREERSSRAESRREERPSRKSRSKKKKKRRRIEKRSPERTTASRGRHGRRDEDRRRPRSPARLYGKRATHRHNCTQSCASRCSAQWADSLCRTAEAAEALIGVPAKMGRDAYAALRRQRLAALTRAEQAGVCRSYMVQAPCRRSFCPQVHRVSGEVGRVLEAFWGTIGRHRLYVSGKYANVVRRVPGG